MKGGGGRLGVTATLAAALPRQRIGTGRRVREWGAAGALVVRPLGQMPTGGGTGGTRDGAQRWGGRAVGRKGRRRLRGGPHRYESCYERGPPACHGITITEAVAVDDESGSRCKISCLPPVSRSRAHRACNIAASWQTPSPGHAPVWARRAARPGGDAEPPFALPSRPAQHWLLAYPLRSPQSPAGTPPPPSAATSGVERSNAPPRLPASWCSSTVGS